MNITEQTKDLPSTFPADVRGLALMIQSAIAWAELIDRAGGEVAELVYSASVFDGQALFQVPSGALDVVMRGGWRADHRRCQLSEHVDGTGEVVVTIDLGAGIFLVAVKPLFGIHPGYAT